ncbi:uncharacterized protein LOC134254857 [Saccostrea cucullata]|uniref:uncharacterized protein LOC134254857 n=1 Tax=Saccostrea cuccullata TaxID=36930 RepID=UPI002ED298EE
MDRDLSEYLKIIVEVMESSYKKWKSLIKENREKYHDLNAFTVEQLMILQVEIAKFMHEQTSSNSFLFHLLHFVKKDCTENDLRNALQEAREDIFKMENKTETSQEPCDTGRKDEQYWKDVDAFLKLAEQKKFSRKLALYGIQINEINVRQPKEGLKWCLRNSKKYEAIIPTTTEERPVRQTLNAFAEEIEKELR